ncbi:MULTISPECIES: 1-phosphofructokinase [Parageobacillus]|jgi:1-phosphofructokinase|uniref:Tagatose-6-phosphate kinase n=1 Tax=Parageobacillus thermoglucosidasius TaxID=1426 RepID=A0A1B7KVH0_PARTM|nr:MULTISPECIES: 1-phosphofructokinase [Parageobacillus]OAT74025.1 1-phosphofructokinase [Parageobacillus thermoglucosidasius]BDG47494.1 1-phosphofructokinase [Parageobacillus sp. KH3-4]
MIYTCTLNPSVDYIVHVDEFRVGELNRAVKTLAFPGGKGINVSRVLKRLGVESTALGFIGGFTGAFIIEQLQNENIACDFVEVPGNTRINVKLKSGTETEINGQGPMIEPKYEEALIQKMQALTEDDVVVLAGSVPSSLSPDIYEKIIDEAKKGKAKVVVDTSGPALKQLLARKPFLAKPNHKELAELFETSFHSKDEIMVYGRRLVELGVENVIVSMAGNGAFYFNKEMTLFAKAPKGTVKNSVGAGDSMVAGFLAAYTSGKSLEEAFAYSVASGSATAFSEDLCTKDRVEQLVCEVNVKRF